MGTLKEKLSYLSETKEAIKQALIKQQVTVTDEDTFRSYADKISGIEGGGGSIQKIDAGENETELPYGEIRAISIVDFQVVYYINEKTQVKGIVRMEQQKGNDRYFQKVRLHIGDRGIDDLGFPDL